jgi:hypothetical protein
MIAMTEPYRHNRFRWWNPANLSTLSEELKKKYTVTSVNFTRDETSLYKDDKQELAVKADTLTAYLSMFRVVLNQEKAEPFTSKDKKLREELNKIYTRDRPTPFPWEFNKEPKIP